MKNILTIICLLMLSIGSTAQTKYQTGMQKALNLWSTNDSEAAANLFERIAQAETANWLPHFYVAQIHVFNSFSEKDEATLNAKLDKAKTFLDKAKSLSPDNPEILVLEAQWYTAWIVFDGQAYGMKYGPKISQLYDTAFKMAPDNPRVVLGKAEWSMGSARFFGQPVDQYCADVKRAIELFDTFKPEGEFYPRGGKEHALQVLESSCKE